MACQTCGGKTDGYKCEKCGVETLLKDPDHPCKTEDGDSAMMAKCAMCRKVEEQCTCKSRS